MELNLEMTLDYLSSVDFCPYVKDCMERDNCEGCPANKAEMFFKTLYEILAENA